MFDGKEISEHCDYGIRISADRLILPKGIKTFPRDKYDVAFGEQWVRRDSFLPLLRGLKAKYK